jgi:hypothetical protein
MDKTKNYSSKKKDAFNRQPATEYRGHTAKVCGCLPSITGHDVKNARKENTIDVQTILFAWEKLAKRRNKVEKLLKKVVDDAYIIGREIHDTDLEKELEGLKMDMFLFDICGNYTAQLAKWFYTYQHCFADKMRMPMTLYVVDRKEMHRTVSELTNGKYVRIVDKLLKHTTFSGDGMFGMSYQLKSNIASQIFLLINSMPNKEIEFKGVHIYRNSDKSTMAAYMVTLDVVVHNAKYNVRKHNMLKRIFDLYDSRLTTDSNSRINFEQKTKKTNAKQTVLVDNYRTIMQKITGKKPLTLPLSAGKKAAISRMANKAGKDPLRMQRKIQKAIANQ